jgi:hypothetical protein
MDNKIIIDNLWLEIKKLRRINIKMYMTMAQIISILNERESEELFKLKIDHYNNEIYIIDDFETDLKNLRNENFILKERVNYLDDELKKIKEKLYNKCFVYTDSEETEDEHDDNDKCGCGKPPHQPCPEIEEYLNSISNVD